MYRLATFNRVVVVLLVCSFVLNGIVLAQTSKLPSQYNTTVYKTQQRIPGPIGLTGGVGAQGLSIKGDKGDTVYNPIPIIIQGQPAAPCTVSQDTDGNTVVTCPDGSSVTIPRPQDGQSRTLQARANPDNGNLEQKYADEDEWLTLYYLCNGKFQVQRCEDDPQS